MEEKTLVILKPDAVQRGFIGDIIKRLEQKGFKLIAMKMVKTDEVKVGQHYSDIVHQPFFPKFAKYMASSPILVMVWQGFNVIKSVRNMIGTKDPGTSNPGTIRFDFAMQKTRKIIAGSDDVESANEQIELWFKPEELVFWNKIDACWLSE